jgi:C4-dicarboxylate transporter, DctQ subunit
METHEEDILPDDWLGRIEFWIAATTLAFAAGLVFTSVVLRYGFAYSVSAFDELTRYSIILGAFVAASRLLHQERHVTVDVLLINLPPRWRSILQILAFMAGAAFCAFLLYTGLQLVMQTYATGTRSMSNLRIPMWIPQSFVPLGAALLLIRFLQKVWHRVAELLGSRA